MSVSSLPVGKFEFPWRVRKDAILKARGNPALTAALDASLARERASQQANAVLLQSQRTLALEFDHRFLNGLQWITAPPRGISKSYGIMVNYLYDPEQIEANHEAFVRGAIVRSSAVDALLGSGTGLGATARSQSETRKRRPPQTLNGVKAGRRLAE
jgi:hypothetical protein